MSKASVLQPQAFPDASRLADRSHPAALALGVDLGGTKLLAGLADAGGRTLVVQEEPTRHGADAPVLQQIADLADRLCAEIGAPRSALKAATVGVPGSVSPKTGRVSLAPNLVLPHDRPLAALLAERLGCPVTLENDVNVAALGEARARPGVESLAFVSYGTGVGLGLVVDGHVLRGARGAAGEIAFLPLGDDPFATAPLSTGGLYEDHVGSAAIRNHYGADISVRDIFDRAAAGDLRAQDALAATTKAAAIGLAAVQALFDPDVIVLGGSIGARPEFAAAARQHLAVLLPFEVVVETSRLDRFAGIEGALGAAADALRSRPIMTEEERA